MPNPRTAALRAVEDEFDGRPNDVILTDDHTKPLPPNEGRTGAEPQRKDFAPNVVDETAKTMIILVEKLDTATRADWTRTRGLMDELMTQHGDAGQRHIETLRGYAEEAKELIEVSVLIRRELEAHIKKATG